MINLFSCFSNVSVAGNSGESGLKTSDSLLLSSSSIEDFSDGSSSAVLSTFRWTKAIKLLSSLLSLFLTEFASAWGLLVANNELSFRSYSFANSRLK